MKILITSDWYAPAVNGVVTSVLNLRRELEARGHEVRVLTLAGSRRSTVENGVYAVGSVDAGRIYPGARLRSAAAGPMVQELIRWRPDVVHSQCEFSTFFLARRIARDANAPLVHTYHTVYEDYTHYFSPSRRWGRRAAALGLTENGAVVFAGMVPPARVPEFYALGDVFVSASTSETQGLTYIEALAAGLPLVCRADPCLAGVVENGANGWQYHTAAQRQACLERLLADEPLRAAMARQAAASAERFSAQRFGGTMARLYRAQMWRSGGAVAPQEGELLWQGI